MVWANANWHWIRYRCRERTVHAHVHIVGNLRLPVNQICMFSDCSRKPMQTQWSHPNPTNKAPSWLGSLWTARRSCIYWLAERFRLLWDSQNIVTTLVHLLIAQVVPTHRLYLGWPSVFGVLYSFSLLFYFVLSVWEKNTIHERTTLSLFILKFTWW